MKPRDIRPGWRFGSLTVVSELDVGPKGRVFLLRCECGQHVRRLGTSLLTGRRFGRRPRCAHCRHHTKPRSNSHDMYLSCWANGLGLWGAHDEKNLHDDIADACARVLGVRARYW